MAHHIYHTRGIVLSSVDTGESNRFYKIFTEELGLVGATAQSVRAEKSKLRYALQDFSFVNVDLVRGKEVWRIVSAGVCEPLNEIKGDPLRTKIFARFCALLLRMLHGEVRDEALFGEVVKVIVFIETCAVKESNIDSIEALFTFRVLAHLGYLDPVGFERFLREDAYTEDALQELEKVLASIVLKINEALRASHL